MYIRILKYQCASMYNRVDASTYDFDVYKLSTHIYKYHIISTHIFCEFFPKGTHIFEMICIHLYLCIHTHVYICILRILPYRVHTFSKFCVAACCSVSQCIAVCRSVSQCVAVCCSVSQCVAVGCSVSVLHYKIHILESHTY